ncbi:MAG: Hpt domain-containing protein [Cyanobacteria bacterium P01_A01_bin.114]
MTDPIFDWNQLAQLAGGDAEFEQELLGLFIGDVEDSLIQLVEAADRADVSKVEHLAHYIKGASANVGATALAHVAGQLEQEAQKSKLNQASSLIETLKVRCQETKHAIEIRY